MPHRIAVRNADGREIVTTDCLTMPDLVVTITRLLHENTGAEVCVREITLDEAQNLRAVRELIQNCQSPAQRAEMRRLFDSLVPPARKEMIR